MSRQPTILIICCAALIGLAYASTIFEPSFALSCNRYWLEPYGDVMTYEIGSRYFAQDAWRFPLFFLPAFSFPEGANIIFSDSIPLLAFIAKIAYKISGYWFNYFGLYLVASFPLLAALMALA